MRLSIARRVVFAATLRPFVLRVRRSALDSPNGRDEPRDGKAVERV
jgi:hypothetical protein